MPFEGDATANENKIKHYSYDDESGLIYLRNRYYDSTTGRFINEDPIKDGLNWYSYCSNNPIKFTDPTGLWEDGDEKYPAFIRSAISKYTDDWIYYNSIGDEDGKARAHNGAVQARELGNQIISRESWGAQDFQDWEDDYYKTEIVIHHSANNDSIAKDEKKHIKRGFSGIGYHFVIGKDGAIYEGRPLEKKVHMLMD